MQQFTFQDVDGIDGMGASPDGLGLSVRTLGDDEFAQQGEGFTQNPIARPIKIAYALAGVAGTAIGAYHGYKRNESVGWAIGWALLGGLAPIIVIPVAFAQGIGKRKGR